MVDADVAEQPGNRPTGARYGLADPRYPMREVFAPEIGPDPKRASTRDDTADQLGGFRGNNTRLVPLFAIPKRSRLFFQIGIKPVVDPGDAGRNDLAMSVLAGDPKGILCVEVDKFGI